MKEELSKKAIIIIYPDGYIDTVDMIDNPLLHMYYFNMIKSYSSYFSKYCEHLSDLGNHHIIDNELVKKGCVIILNWDNLSELSERQKESELYFMLPLEYGSIIQLKITREMVIKHSKKHLNMYNLAMKRCSSTYEDYVLKKMKKQEIYLKEGMKNDKF